MIAQLDKEDPPSIKDLAELDRLADIEDTRVITATSEGPTLTQILEINPLLLSFQGDLTFSVPSVSRTAKLASSSLLGS